MIVKDINSLTVGSNLIILGQLDSKLAILGLNLNMDLAWNIDCTVYIDTSNKEFLSLKKIAKANSR